MFSIVLELYCIFFMIKFQIYPPVLGKGIVLFATCLYVIDVEFLICGESKHLQLY